MDFFPSVKRARVEAMWRRVFGASKRVARLLSSLTTFEGHLPQGSPASNAIANLVTLPLALEIHALCSARGLVFSIYVDDITISGSGARDVVGEVIGMIRRTASGEGPEGSRDASLRFTAGHREHSQPQGL